MVVLVFDNIDRCEPEIASQVLSGLKTFLDEPKCFYLIPCDDGKIKKHFLKSGAESDFLDKIFQAYIRIPLIAEENRIAFIEDCITKAEFDLKDSDRIKISEILTLAYKGETPRQIKRFFNDFISYYKLAKTIDVNSTFLLKDIAHFTFMITIKQKWPEIEQTLLKNPNAFVNYKNNIRKIAFPANFVPFLDTCIGWIDLEGNIADFIYFKDAKQTGGNVQKIIIDGNDDFILNVALIQDIDHFILSLLNDEKYILFDTAMSRVMNLLKKLISEDSKLMANELFKTYVKYIIKYDNMQFESKQPSCIISHSSFFLENTTLILTLHRNDISDFETHACKIIRQTGHNGVTANLFVTFLKQFNEKNIAKIFNDPAAEEWTKLYAFLNNCEVDVASKVIPHSFFQALFNSLTFGKEESNITQVLARFNNVLSLKSIRQPIGVKLEQAFAPIYSHQAHHPNDKFIIDGLKIFNKADFADNTKNTLTSYIHNRVNILITHGHIEQSVDYFITGMGLHFAGLAPLIQTGNVIAQLANFNLFIQKVPVDILESALEIQQFKDQIFATAKIHNVIPSVFQKLSDNFIKTKILFACYKDISCLNALLDDIKARRSRITDEELLKIEDDILKEYAQPNHELIVGNFSEILSRLSLTKSKDFILETGFNYYKGDVHKNCAPILQLFSFIEDESAKPFISDAIETLIVILQDNFNFNNQISAIKILDKLSKPHFTEDQIKTISYLIHELPTDNAEANQIISSLKSKLDYYVTSPNTFDYNFTGKPSEITPHSMLLDLKKYKYEISIHPSENTNYWRYGLKLAKTSDINTVCVQPGTPLFHLTKGNESDSLFVTYYDEKNQLQNGADRLIKKTYKKEPITLELSLNENGIQVSVKDENNEALITEPILDTTYSYGRLLAWGDTFDYQINSTIKRIPLSNN